MAQVALELVRGGVAAQQQPAVGTGFATAAGDHVQDNATDNLGPLKSSRRTKGRQAVAGSTLATAPTFCERIEKTGHEGNPDRSGRVVQTWVVKDISAR